MTKKAPSVFVLFVVGFFASSMLADEVNYRITFEGSWTLQPLPGGAHFSPLIGATHNDPGEIFSVGGFASAGVEDVAETGQNAELIGEINDGLASGSIGTLISRPGNVGPSAVVQLDFSTTSEFPLLTFLTMIAPSPDWIVAVHDLNLQDELGNWRNSIVVDLNSYDAGTENGASFSTSNSATVPHDVIQALDQVEPNNPLFGIGSIARITISRLDSFPSTHSVDAGDTQSGSLADATCSDDEYLRLIPTPKSIANGLPVVATFEANVPTSVTDFSLNVESSTSTAAAIQLIELYDFENKSFEFVATNTISFGDSTNTINPFGQDSRFVNGKGMVRIRMSWAPSGLVLSFPWVIRIDNVFLEFDQ